VAISFFLFILLKLAPISHAQIESDKIRVLIAQWKQLSLGAVDLTIDGRTVSNGESYTLVRCEEGKIKLGAFGESTGRVILESPTGFLHINNRPYRERVILIPKRNECLVINVLDREKYLAGLLNKEMSPLWPLEALKAQAVAARSYAAQRAKENSSQEYDLEGSTMDQVYEGSASETPRSHQAVEGTRGILLVYGNEPLKAYFHSNCGGKTETPDRVWGGKIGPFAPVACPFHTRQRDQVKWQAKIKIKEVMEALSRRGLWPSSQPIDSLVTQGTPQGPRLATVLVTNESGENRLLSPPLFREALGFNRIKSTSFRVEREGNGFRFTGTGFGHGVGLCQMGARAMAEQGNDFRMILQRYYPRVTIQVPTNAPTQQLAGAFPIENLPTIE
jgi:stage II sporulation protein D